MGTVFTVDSALQHTCASFRQQAAHGEISAAECDLLIDGAILLAVHLEALIQDAHAGRPPSWPDAGQRPALRVLAGGQQG
ncbi:MAG TPA: hypothetical protein DHU96_13140 [Actinobacteria bacterium]|nr:hypothetical protein [Actinomycetota bacterium]